jgi:hypothetical protein
VVKKTLLFHLTGQNAGARRHPAFLSAGCNDFHRFPGPFYRLKTIIGCLLFCQAKFRKVVAVVSGNLVMQPKKAFAQPG